MADTTTPAPEDDQNLWRSVYTTDGGWGPDEPFADHKSIAAPALARFGDVFVCAHRGSREETSGWQARTPLRWTSHDPASSKPYAQELARLTAAARPADGADADGTALSGEVAAQLEKAAAAYEQSRKWTADAKIPDQVSVETPALAVFDGKLRSVYLAPDPDNPLISLKRYLMEIELDSVKGQWSSPEPVLDEEDPLDFSHLGKDFQPQYMFLAGPALIEYADRLHLLWADTTHKQIIHLVRGKGSGSSWEVPLGKDGRPSATPALRPDTSKQWTDLKYPANLAVAVHEGALHLVYRGDTGTDTSGRLWHSVYDGTSWSKATSTGHDSRRGAALASYDGKLHAVYPDGSSTRLAHTTLANGSWGTVTLIEGHDSKNTPALLTFRDGPDGSEALLMVHRGIDRYVPPVPKPYVPQKVTSTHETGCSRMTDYATNASSKANHQLTVSSVTFDDGTRGVTARLSADFFYFWGRFYYWETSGTLTGRLKIRKTNGHIHEQRFEADLSSGSCDVTLQWTGLEPGTYEVWIGAGTRKVGGYWFGTRDDRDQPGIWSAIEFHPIGATVSVPAG
ncbi:hypothetical protein [Streptomyces sp. NPDC003952]